MAMRKPNDEYYYYNSVRQQVIVFMSLFKGMKVVDEELDCEDTMRDQYETPIDIIYTPQERKKLEEEYEKLNPDSQYDMKVPIFGVSINSIVYDSTRALNFYRRRRIKQNSKQYNDRMPIPYNIGMTLSIVAKYESHIHQISENIVPFITPYVVVKIKENVCTLNEVPRELKIDFDGNINKDIPLEWLDTDRRTVRGELNFVIRGWIYKPLTDQPGPILHIPIRFFKSADFDLDKGLLGSTEVSGPNWEG